MFAIGLRQPYTLERVLWPLVDLPATEPRATTGRILEYATDWVAYLLSNGHGAFLAVYLGTLVGAVLLWLVDGAPGLPRPDWVR